MCGVSRTRKHTLAHLININKLESARLGFWTPQHFSKPILFGNDVNSCGSRDFLHNLLYPVKYRPTKRIYKIETAPSIFGKTDVCSWGQRLMPHVRFLFQRGLPHTLHNCCCNDDNDNNDLLVAAQCRISFEIASLSNIIRKADRADIIYKQRGETVCLFKNLDCVAFKLRLIRLVSLFGALFLMNRTVEEQLRRNRAKWSLKNVSSIRDTRGILRGFNIRSPHGPVEIRTTYCKSGGSTHKALFEINNKKILQQHLHNWL
jgi:hypothetical protein